MTVFTLHRTRLTLPLLVAAVTVAAVPAGASAGRDGSMTVTSRVVSGPSPYGDCAEGFGRGAEASPALAGEGRRDEVVVAWQQDATHAAGGEITTQAAGVLSTDGPLGGGPCEPGGRAGENAGAPSLATGPDGTVWAAYVVNGPDRLQLLVARRPPSAGWTSRVVTALEPSAPNTTYLPATIAVDPLDAQRVHVAYVRNVFPAGTLAVHRSSTDAGQSWSDEHVISVGPTPGGYDFAEQLVALGGDQLLAVSSEVDQADLATIAPHTAAEQDLTQAPIVQRARRSADGGRTWSAPVVVHDLDNGGVRDRERGGTALRSLVRPSVAVDPSGTVHVAGESVSADGSRTEMRVASSRDGGASWLPTVAASVPGVVLAAAIAADRSGRLAVSWLDLSDDRPGDEPLTAGWRFVTTTRAGTWSSPQALSAPFDLRPLAPAYVGDQGALLGLHRGFAAATVVGTGLQDDPSNVVLSFLRP